MSLQQKPTVIANAILIAENGFASVSVRTGNVGGRKVYQLSSLAELLVTRHISENIRRITKVKQGDRQSIVRNVRSLVSEGTDFNLIKLDIKSFYESINTFSILKELKSDAAFSRQSINLLESFFRALNQQGLQGLPRGFELSATLAEYAMREFDKAMSEEKGVRFYSRYVDDILIITSPRKLVDDILDIAKDKLPDGLEFRKSKTQFCQFLSSISAPGQVEHSFTFLGYSVEVGKIFRDGNRRRRDVFLDVAPSKVKKIKKRISLSIMDFNNGGSFDDLYDRIKMLTSNYAFYDNKNGSRRLAGIRYNYPMLEIDRSRAISQLDHFLYNSLNSLNPRNRIRPNLTHPQRLKLLGFSFRTGFIRNRFYSFSKSDLHRITKCWSHA